MKSEFIEDSQDHITEEAVEHSTARLIPPMSVIMVIRSGILKHTLPVAINKREITVNQDLKAFLPADEILASYLLYTFKMMSRSILGRVRAVTADNIEFAALRKREIPVPPLELQTQFSTFVHRVEATKTTVRAQLAALTTLRAKMMQEFFG